MVNFPNLKSTANVLDVIAHFNEAGSSIMKMFEVAMEGASELSSAERELIATYVSASNNCDFCERSHAGAAIALGVDKEVVSDLRCGNTAKIPEKLQPVITLARLVAVDPSSVTATHIKSILDMGWSEQTAYDTLFVASAFSFINRIASSSGISITEEEGRQIGSYVAQNGYAASVDEFSS